MGDDIEDERLKAHLLRLSVRVYMCINKFLTSINICTFRNKQCSKKSKYPYLYGISLRNNHIKELHEDIFMALTNVIFIILDNNEIESLPIYVFKYNTQLTNINLNYNHLTHIHTNIFISNTKLIKIHLIKNKIKHFTIECKSLRNLKRLYLNGNPLHSLDEATIKPLLILTYYNNNLKITFDTSSFTCYSMLCNMSWLIRNPRKSSSISLYRQIKNSILIYDTYEDRIGLLGLYFLNSYNDDLYNYLYMRINNCKLQGNCSMS